MKKILFCMFCILPLGRAYASFEDSPVGGRGAGVDGAMTAMADDVFALYYNPAGTVFLSKPELGAYFGRLYGGLTDNSNLSRDFFGYVYPFHGEAVGLSYNALDLAGLYKEEIFGVSYAWKMGDDFSLGVTGKNYRKSVGHDFNTENAELNGVTQLGVSDPVFLNGHVADAWGADAGAIYRLGKGWRTGFMIRNVNEANMALGSDDNDPVPRSWNWGLAREWDNHAVMLDATRERFTQMETVIHGGMETWVMGGHFGMRAGGGIGDREYRQVTAGFSYRMALLQLDYGFMIPLESIEGTTGTQQLSLILRFGTPPAKPLLHPVVQKPMVMDLSDLLDDSSAAPSSPKSTVQPELTVLPAYVSLSPGQSQQFTARVAGTADGRVVWDRMPALGSISQSGIYQAPSLVLFSQDVWITGKSEANAMHYERAVVHLHAETEGPVTLKLHVGWETGASELQPYYAADIEKLATVLRQYPHVNVLIKAYGDDEGTEGANARLAEKRAQAIRTELTRTFGIESERVRAQTFDPTRPSSSDPTADERQTHRQVEVVLSAPDVPTISISEADPSR